MIKYTKLLIFALILSLFSCKYYDPKPFVYHDILSLTSEINKDNKYLFTNRLAFAKLLAKALENVELKDYIKRISKDKTVNSFNEIIFALHKDDIIEDGKTLQDYILDEMDNEIKSLYKDDFIAKILEQDPMLSIKLPDIFYNVNWEVCDFSPMVYAKTIDPIGYDKLGPYYIGYHCSGYQDRLYQLRKVNKFSLVVKFSEDYILLDVDKLANFQGIPLSYIFPQYSLPVWDKLKGKILSRSYKSPVGNNLYYIKKRVMFDLYKELEENEYRKYIDSTGCDEKCLRDCVPVDSTYNTIESITERTNITDIFWDNSYILRENKDLLMYYNSFLGGDIVEVVDKYYIAGFRIADFITRKIRVDLKPEIEKYDEIGKIKIPYVYVEVEDEKFNKIQLNHVVEKGWNSPKNRDRDIEFFSIYRENLIAKFRIGIGKLNDISDEYVTYYQDVGNEYITYCEPPVKNYPFGNILAISYRY